MTAIIKFREKMILFYRDYETWIRIIAKFAGMLLVFTTINQSLGYVKILQSLPVNLLLSLICSILPGGFIVFITAVVVLANMFTLNMFLGILTLIVILILYLLFLKFTPRQALVLLAVPVLMHWHLEFMIPACAGLVFAPYAIIPAAAGVFLVKFVGYAAAAAPSMGSIKDLDFESTINGLISVYNNMKADHFILLYLIAAAAAITVSYCVSRLSVDYSWYIAIAAGAVVEIIAALMCARLMNVDNMSSSILAGTLIGVLAGLVFQFFRCVVDYKRKEFVQFQDEEYYYYVKAIPRYMVQPRQPQPKDDMSDAASALADIRKGLHKEKD